MLQTKALSIGYKHQTPLFPPLTLQLEIGKLTAVVGANGVGKSSLLRTLAGLQAPLSGAVWIDDAPMSRLKTIQIAQKLSLVLTQRPTDAYLTVEDTLALGRFPYLRWNQRLQKEDCQIIKQALELTNIEPLAQKRLATLSDGQFQKVMIARALVQDTPILLLDEPTAHLDLPNRFMIFQLLHDLAKQTRKAVLVATHDLEPVLQIVDKIWLLQPNTLHEGIPEALVMEGIIAKTFGNDRLQYDEINNTFTTVLACPQHFVQLVGKGMAYHQTKKALQRIGFGIAENASIKISIQTSEAALHWHTEFLGSFETLTGLLEKLENKYL